MEPRRSISSVNSILAIQNMNHSLDSNSSSNANPAQSPNHNSNPSPVQSSSFNYLQSLHSLQMQILRHCDPQITQQLQSHSSSHNTLPIQSTSGFTNDLSPTPERLNSSGSSTSGQLQRSHQNGSRNSSTASIPTSATITNSHNRNGRNCNHEAGKELIDLVTCKLCKGYLIDASTIDVCMHTFCRPCAVKFLREKHRCPECNVEIKDKRFLNRLKSDITMQNIVYKLVPGLYENEMARRRKFYQDRPSNTPRQKHEMFGDIPPCKTIRPDDMLNIGITWDRGVQDDDPIKMYFLCRADSTIRVLKKLIIRKFGLDWPIKIYYGNSEIFFDLTTLIDVAVTFSWSPESKVLSLSFKEQPMEEDEHNKKSQTNQVNSSPLVNSGLDPSSDP